MSLLSLTVNVELDDIEDDVLLELVAERGLHKTLADFDDQEMADELHGRGAPEPMADAFASQAVTDWLRSANPPQEVRDAYWEQFGRILL